MRRAIYTCPLTISMSDEDFNQIKKTTDDKEISMAEWFRAAAKLKLEHDAREEVKNEK